MRIRFTLILGALASGNIVLAFITQWYVLTVLGPGVETDAYFASTTIPQLMLLVAGSSLTHVLVPMLSVRKGKELDSAAWNFYQGILLLFSAVGLLLFFTAAWWVPLIVPGFSQEAWALTVHLSRIQVGGMVLTAGLSVLWAANHARRNFQRVELSSAFANAVCLAVLYVALPVYGIAAAAWVQILRVLLQNLLLMGGLGGYSAFRPKDEVLKESWRKLRPLLLGTIYYKTDMFVDRFLASMAPAGELSLLHAGRQLYSSGGMVVNKALIAPVGPPLAEAAHKNKHGLFRSIFRRRFLAVLGASLLCFAVLVLIGEPVLQLLFEHGSFNVENVHTLWIFLLALGGVWFGGNLGQILSSSFYACGDTVTPTRIGVIGYTLGLVLKVGGFYLYGVLGIAIGTSIYYLFNALALRIFLHRKMREAEA